LNEERLRREGCAEEWLHGGALTRRSTYGDVRWPCGVDVEWTTVVVWSGAAARGTRMQQEEKKREDGKEK